MQTQCSRYPELSKALLAWADELDSGKWRQIYGRESDEGSGRCALGVWRESGLFSAEVWFRGEELVVDEVNRLVPASAKNFSVPTLNDSGRIPFSVFAQAARNVAYREQEHSYGLPIAVVEDAREEALA